MNFADTYTSTELLQEYKVNQIDPREDPVNHLRISGQGGLLAGVVSLGGFHVLSEEGYLPYVRGIDAISAAVPNAIAALSGKTLEAKRFYKQAWRSGFINWAVLPHPINPDVLREFMEQEVKDIESVLAHPAELGIGLTRRVDCQPVAKSSRELTKATLIPTAMEAVHVAVLMGQAEGENIDGGYSWENNWKLSEYFGATHTYELSNAPYRTWKFQKWPTRLVGASLVVASGEVMNFPRFGDFARRQEVIINAPQPAGSKILYPSEGIKLPGALSVSPRKIESGFVAGENAVCRDLGIPLRGIEIPDHSRRRALRLFGKSATAKTVIPLAA